MTSVAKLFLAGFVLATGVAIAQAAATDPDVIARQELMRAQGGAAKTLGDMAKGATAFDAAAAQAAKDTLIGTSKDIEAKFAKETADPEQDAAPAVWANWDDYLLKAKALEDAATALDTTSVETIAAGMAAVGGSCSACHKAYRL